MKKFLGGFFKMIRSLIWVALISFIVTFGIAIYYPQGVKGAIEIFRKLLQ